MESSTLPRLGIIDSLIVILYFIVLWFIAFYKQKKSSDSSSEFFLAGRKLTLPAFVATIVTTWYGGILGVGEHAWTYGLSTWIVFGLVYYIHALVFAFFVAPLARKGQYTNLPDQLERYFGKSAAVAGATMLLIVTVPSAYVLMLGTLIRMIYPLPLPVAVTVGALLSILYLWNSGLRTVVRTDIFQFILMFGGFIILIIFAMIKLPPWQLPELLPEKVKSFSGGQPLSYFILWLILAAQTYIEPSIHQRCYAAESPRTARWGMITSVGAWFIFDIMTVSCGLYARALLPDLADPVAAYPALASYLLPVGILGIFAVGLFSTVMSTVDSYSFLSSVLLGRDIIGRIKNNKEEKNVLLITRISLLVVAIMAIILAVIYNSVITIWIVLGSIATPALLLPVLTSFWQKSRMSPTLATFNIIFTGTVTLLWTATEYFPGRGECLLNIQPVFAGLLTSTIIYFLDIFIFKKKSWKNGVL